MDALCEASQFISIASSPDISVFFQFDEVTICEGVSGFFVDDCKGDMVVWKDECICNCRLGDVVSVGVQIVATGVGMVFVVVEGNCSGTGA